MTIGKRRKKSKKKKKKKTHGKFETKLGETPHEPLQERGEKTKETISWKPRAEFPICNRANYHKKGGGTNRSKVPSAHQAPRKKKKIKIMYWEYKKRKAAKANSLCAPVSPMVKLAESALGEGAGRSDLYQS